MRQPFIDNSWIKVVARAILGPPITKDVFTSPVYADGASQFIRTYLYPRMVLVCRTILIHRTLRRICWRRISDGDSER
jgi:hypothetical protein